MPLSFLDLGLHPTDVQQAAANTFQQQVAGNLAVLPKADLRGAISQALQRRRAQQSLGTQREKLALARKDARYTARQLPLEVATGALSGALGVYGGVRAQQAATRQEGFQREALGMQQQTLAQQQAATAAQVAQAGRIKRALDLQGYDPTYIVPGT